MLTQLDHPLLQHKLTLLRDKSTHPSKFRRILGEISELMTYEVTRDLKLSAKAIETPFEKGEFPALDDDLIIVSILRAGSAMLDGVTRVVPFASIGHIGIYRDKFVKTTVEYYFRIPEPCKGRRVLLLDPILATGDTAVAAISRLKDYGVGRIDLLTLLASPEGIQKVESQFPEVHLHTLAQEREINENGYILPGMGDAGGRIYGTA